MRRTRAVPLVALLVAACGGGGGEDPAPAPAAVAGVQQTAAPAPAPSPAPATPAQAPAAPATSKVSVLSCTEVATDRGVETRRTTYASQATWNDFAKALTVIPPARTWQFIPGAIAPVRTEVIDPTTTRYVLTAPNGEITVVVRDGAASRVSATASGAGTSSVLDCQ